MLEKLVSSILDQLAAILVDSSQQEFMKLVIDAKPEMQKLETNLKAIQCVLEDAEQKQMFDKSVRLWLERLKEVSYDMEDVLDEWRTEILKLKIDRAEEVLSKKGKVSSAFSYSANYCGQLVRRHDIASKIKKINENLDVIAKEKDMHRLARLSEIKQPRRPESTSFVDVSKIHGRDVIKNTIVSTILLGGNEIQTISIVGMGGIGKTALAQLILNDPEVRAHFNHVIWVYVSDFFDQDKIARAILGGIDQDSLMYLQNPIPLQGVLTKICEKIKNSKFFLVLDDVWTDHDEKWEPLKVVFQQGMPGSRVLLTTRKESIATGMGSSQVFPLKELSDEICWLIIRQVAFVGKDNNLCGKLEDIGREIAKKCKGSPLVAKTLGGLLREKKTRNEWHNVLNNEIWKLNVTKEYIYSPLLLSYYDLPSEIRPCLLYCAIFPKDFIFRPKDLIKHWMSHGYLKNDENSEMEEEKGEEYFNYLVSCSFFQDFEKNRLGEITGYSMHDLIHHFLHYLSNEVVEVSENWRLDLSSKKGHHLRVMTAKIDEFFGFINGIKKPRSLVAGGQMCYASCEALQDLFKTGKHLRLLRFALGACNGLKVKEIPNEIRKLIHLRYLNLSDSVTLEKLPEEVCELYNLQHLILLNCSRLKKLPVGIDKLINLKSLNTLYCGSLTYYPKGIGRLISLRELIFVRARIDCNHDKEFSVGDMENLNLLRGRLGMRMVGSSIDLEEIKRAKFHQKIHLNQLDVGHPKFYLNTICEVIDLSPNTRFVAGLADTSWAARYLKPEPPLPMAKRKDAGFDLPFTAPR